MEDPYLEDNDQTHTSYQAAGQETLGTDDTETTHDLVDDLPSVSAEAGQPRLPALGDYILLGKIGAGGMGRVFKAKHRTMDRLVALKMLPPGRMKDPEQVSRFHREVKAAAKLFHPNIVTAFDAGEQAGIHYLVMEYVDGSALSKTVKQHGPVMLDTAISYILQAAQGLEYAHSREVVHRDIKPSNLMLDEDGTVKILDMGTARFDEEEKDEDNLTQTGVIMGTVNYMSPEQARDAHKVDYRTDIYSLGCTFYYLLTGKPLYEGDMIQTLLAHAQKPIPNVQEYDREIPDWVDDVLKRMLAKKPDDRYQSITELIASVEESLRGEQDDGDDESREIHGMLSASDMLASLAARGDSVAHNIVGIDLGTNHSAVAYVNAVGKPVVVTDAEDQWQIPSAVLINGISTVVGYSALQQADERPSDLALEIKRFVGKQFFPEVLQGDRYPPEVLLALVLSRLVDNMQRRVEGPCHQVVIAVPAHFDEVARKAVQDAGYIAGVEVIDIINEPMAAALAYGYQQLHEQAADQVTAPAGNVLIMDMGAGKLDVMALKRQGHQWAAVASDGDTRLGGRDWDDCLEEMIAQEFQKQYQADPRAREEDVLRLWKTAESVKHRLSQRDNVTVRFQAGKHIVEQKITRDQFEERCVELLGRVRQCVNSTIENAKWDVQDIDQVILVGAATQMPMIQKLLREIIAERTSVTMIDPSSIAQGAALHASYLRVRESNGEPEQVYSNVSSHSLGIVGTDTKTGRKINAVVIPRNTQLPVTTQRTFKTHKEGQESVMIQIIEGESLSPQECQPIGQCVIENLPVDLPARSPVTVEFHYSSNGRLNIFVESPDTGYRATKELTRAAGLANVDLHRWREWVETVMLCSSMV